MAEVLLESYLHGILLFSVLTFACAEPWSVAILQILIMGLFTAVVWQGRLTLFGPVARRLLPMMLGLALLGVLQLSSERSVMDPFNGSFFTVSRWATQKAVLLWLSYAALALAAAAVLQTTPQVKRLAWTILLLGIATGVMGLGLRSQSKELLMGFRKLPYLDTAPFGPFVNRDHAASLLAMSGMLGWGLFFAQLSQFDRDYRSRWDKAALATLTFGLTGALAFCIFKTGSRGGTNSFFAATFLLGLACTTAFSRGRARMGAYAALLSVACLYCYILALFPEWRGYVDGQWTPTLRIRWDLYRSGWEMLKDSPVFGYGLGAFQFAFPPYQNTSLRGVVQHAHNDWLELSLQVGLGGLSLSLGCALAAMGSALRAWANCTSREVRAIAGGAFGAVLAASTHMLLDFPSQIPGNAVTLLLVACLFCARPTFEGKEGGYSERRCTPLWLKGASVAAALLVAVPSIPPIFADYHALRARNVPLDARSYHLARALAWDGNPRYAAQLGATYAAMGKENPTARQMLYSKGLQTVRDFQRRYPANPELRRLQDYFAFQIQSTRK